MILQQILWSDKVFVFHGIVLYCASDRNLDSPVPAPRGRVERRRGSPASTASTTARYYQSLLCDQYWWNKFFVTLPENFPQCFCRCQAQYISDTSGECRSLPYLHLRRQQRNNKTKVVTLFNTLFTTKQIMKKIEDNVLVDLKVKIRDGRVKG